MSASQKQRTPQGYELPIPSDVDLSPEVVGLYSELNFTETVQAAESWKDKHHIQPAEDDEVKATVAIIDDQGDFVLSAEEEGARLSIGAKAVTDLIALLAFIYTNLRVISKLVVTLDTHFLSQIFHPIFWVSTADGKTHPNPFTAILAHQVGEDPSQGHLWKPNPMMCNIVMGEKFTTANYAKLLRYAQFYCSELSKRNKPPLVIWPYHCRLGSKGATLVPSLMRALDFFEVARWSKVIYRIKGNNALTEAYSPFGDEVTQYGKAKIGEESEQIIKDLLESDILIIAGQALSHCVRAAIYDILQKILQQDPELAKKVYILIDATSPVPGFEQQAQDAVADFKAHGMNIVTTAQPIAEWPNLSSKVRTWLQKRAA